MIRSSKYLNIIKTFINNEHSTARGAQQVREVSVAEVCKRMMLELPEMYSTGVHLQGIGGQALERDPALQRLDELGNATA